MHQFDDLAAANLPADDSARTASPADTSHISETQSKSQGRSQTNAGPAAKTRLFVLDTNVCLHDAACVRKFEEHDIAIPITVLEELDQFKKGHGDINYQARQFLRSLDELTRRHPV